MIAEHGKMDRKGWAALDKISLTRSDDCMYEPTDALPSTPGPTLTSTVPPDDDVFCTFQEDLCDFMVEGQDNFLFSRTKGEDVNAIATDHHGNSDGYFLYAWSNTTEPDMVYTYVVTNTFDGEHHPIECFNFWFFIDGFLVSRFCQLKSI